MSIVVSYLPSTIGRLTVIEAAKEAHLRKTPMVVVTVPEGVVDVDLIAEERQRHHAEITTLLQNANLSDIDWTLRVATGSDIAQTLLDAVGEEDAELIVIGARRRTPVGKMILGSVSQSVLLRASVPVLVVKSPR